MADVEKRIPKHCTCPALSVIFGLPDGFPSGIDVINCFYHCQYPIDYGDFKVIDVHGKGLSYIVTSNHKKLRIPDLYDNSQNIKIRIYDGKRKT